MVLQGSIERFNIVNILQFLAYNRATGVLEVRDFEEFGFIYFVDGYVEGVSLPVSDERLGVRLVRLGAISEDQLARALVETQDGGEGRVPKPLGERLVEQGLVSPDTVKDIVRRLTVARVFELAHWATGVFSYSEPKQMPRFGIRIQGCVEELLLLVQHWIDKGRRPRKRSPQRPLQSTGPCLDCLVPDCSAEIRAKYLKGDVCLWRRMSASTCQGPAIRPLTDIKSSVGQEGEPRRAKEMGDLLEPCLSTTRLTPSRREEEDYVY